MGIFNLSRKTIEDYDKNHPILVDGEHDAPPEDVGGVIGYYQFLQIYNNPKHEYYDEIREWAAEQEYREYSPKLINRDLKRLQLVDEEQ